MQYYIIGQNICISKIGYKIKCYYNTNEQKQYALHFGSRHKLKVYLA